MQKALLFKKLKNNAVQCTACRQYCTISPGGSGICGVRQNVDGELNLLVYAKASAVHVDPVEKKPLYHFLPGTEIFSLGTVGCNFSCSFCQNWDLSQVTKDLKKKLLKEKKEARLDVEVGQLGYELVPEQIVEQCVARHLPSIAYTYNEPTIFFEYLYDTAKLARERGIRNVMVSNGYTSDEAFDYLKDCIDAINIDLKSFSDDFYRQFCGARLQPVLDTIKKAHALGIWVEVTTLVIPGKNDSEEELRQIAEFLAGVDKTIPWHISAFFPTYKMLDAPPTGREILERAYDIGKKAGLQFVYVGNIIDDERSGTYCPACGAILIERRGYSVAVKKLKDGACQKCGAKIPGIWK